MIRTMKQYKSCRNSVAYHDDDDVDDTTTTTTTMDVMKVMLKLGLQLIENLEAKSLVRSF